MDENPIGCFDYVPTTWNTFISTFNSLFPSSCCACSVSQLWLLLSAASLLPAPPLLENHWHLGTFDGEITPSSSVFCNFVDTHLPKSCWLFFSSLAISHNVLGLWSFIELDETSWCWLGFAFNSDIFDSYLNSSSRPYRQSNLSLSCLF